MICPKLVCGATGQTVVSSQRLLLVNRTLILQVRTKSDDSPAEHWQGGMPNRLPLTNCASVDPLHEMCFKKKNHRILHFEKTGKRKRFTHSQIKYVWENFKHRGELLGHTIAQVHRNRIDRVNKTSRGSVR